jgi:hypothetical protein
MPCHYAKDVIYMEEVNGDANKTTLGVNAADIQGSDSRFPFRPAAHTRRGGLGPHSYGTLTGNLTVTAKAAPDRRLIFKYLSEL